MSGLSGQIEAAVAPFVERGEVVGVVALVADSDGVVAQTAVGWADQQVGTPMRPDTVFWIASQTKPVTATALMMLVDEGRLGLDDPVGMYLPEFADLWVIRREAADRRELVRQGRPVTVRDLLAHTSGLPFRSFLEEPTLDLLPLEVGARGYAMMPLGSQPGTRYEYSNAGINTAGRLIEVLSGVSYEAFLEERLLGPLSLSNTTFRPSPAQQARLACAYRPLADGSGYEETPISLLHYPLNAPDRQPMPAGGLFSTASDVARFCRMILNGGRDGARRYVSADAVAQMTRKQTEEAVEERYGLGWSLGNGSFGHGGACGTAMTVYPEKGLISVFLVQHVGFIGQGERCRGAFETALVNL